MSERYSRQSFLGENSEYFIGKCVVGIIGLGGGGSHIVQQLAHVGFKNYVIYDFDYVEGSNLNRTVGATAKDVKMKSLKIHAAKRLIRGLQPKAKIKEIKTRWQNNPLPFRGCDIIFGCVDGFDERRQLEASARRYLIPYIDIGLTVNHVLPEPPRMGGQVILSLPGNPCMWCIGFLTGMKLGKEASEYGNAGPKPQVIWANGVLASSAVGIAVDLITGWTKTSQKVIYLEYDGNSGVVTPHERIKYVNLATPCTHYVFENIGDPIFRNI